MGRETGGKAPFQDTRKHLSKLEMDSRTLISHLQFTSYFLH